MLSFFPELLFLAPFSALLIRLSAAAVFVYLSTQHLKNIGLLVRAFGALEGLCAALLFLGLYTQLGAILGVVVAGLHIVRKEYTLPLSTLLLLFVMCLSLLITGAGPFTVTIGSAVFPLSFDLPL
jgi:hypothetical protein